VPRKLAFWAKEVRLSTIDKNDVGDKGVITCLDEKNPGVARCTDITIHDVLVDKKN
jgi:hypothetical protein